MHNHAILSPFTVTNRKYVLNQSNIACTKVCQEIYRILQTGEYMIEIEIEIEVIKRAYYMMREYNKQLSFTNVRPLRKIKITNRESP
jgi:hypothetical protein